MLISVINHTAGLISDSDLQTAIRAINRQVVEDFAPHWGMSASLRLEGHTGPAVHVAPEPDIQHAIDMRGDAVIYIWHPTDVRVALGYHALNFLGIPYGFVFPEVAAAVGEAWTTTLSHEVMEMIADPEVNRLVIGPHPADPRQIVFHWYEMCDAVQTQTYEIDGVPVSNFVLPLYFTNSEELGSRNDFLNRHDVGAGLQSFGVSPGGYVGFVNPMTGQHDTFFAEGDTIAMRRMEVKRGLGLTRRSQRYQARTDTGRPITHSLRNMMGLP